MARITPIRISQNDRKEYARLVRNARAKVNRTRKSHGIDLAGEIVLPKIDAFQTRKQFNEWKEQAESFTNRHNLKYQFVTNEYGVTRSKSQLNRMQAMRRREINHAKKEFDRIKNIKIKQGGKPFATVEQRTTHMSTPDVTGIRIPKEFDFKKVQSERTMKSIEEVGERRQEPDYLPERMSTMQRNFIDSLISVFDSDADELVEKLGELTSDEFHYLYTENEEFDFDNYFYINDNGIIIVDKNDGDVQKMLDLYRQFERDILKKNPDLKGF